MNHIRPTESRSSGSPLTKTCDHLCYYRCFGQCSRVFSKVEDLRLHMKTCSFALAVLRQTFGDLLFNTKPSGGGDETPTETQNSNSDSSSRENNNPLCLCLYCDVSSEEDLSFGELTTIYHHSLGFRCLSVIF